MPPTDHEEGQQPAPVYIRIEGVVLPTWVAIAACAVFIVAMATLGLETWSLRVLEREIRVLELHAQDIEGVLITRAIARRSDFAAWQDGSDRGGARRDRAETPPTGKAPPPENR